VGYYMVMLTISPSINLSFRPFAVHFMNLILPSFFNALKNKERRGYCVFLNNAVIGQKKYLKSPYFLDFLCRSTL